MSGLVHFQWTKSRNASLSSDRRQPLSFTAVATITTRVPWCAFGPKRALAAHLLVLLGAGTVDPCQTEIEPNHKRRPLVVRILTHRCRVRFLHRETATASELSRPPHFCRPVRRRLHSAIYAQGTQRHLLANRWQRCRVHGRRFRDNPNSLLQSLRLC